MAELWQTRFILDYLNMQILSSVASEIRLDDI